MGDGALVEFASVVDAVECAVAIQRSMRETNTDCHEDRSIVFRIGINLGDVIIEGDDIYGDGVNIAARLEGIAESGGIAISEDVWRQVRGKVDAKFVDIDEQNLKNIEGPVRVYRADLEGTTIPAAPALTVPPKPSIAVLPFQNMSGDSEQDYFCDGMVEDIITGLSRIKWLFVIARNSSFVYKAKVVAVDECLFDIFWFTAFHFDRSRWRQAIFEHKLNFPLFFVIESSRKLLNRAWSHCANGLHQFGGLLFLAPTGLPILAGPATNRPTDVSECPSQRSNCRIGWSSRADRCGAGCPPRRALAYC